MTTTEIKVSDCVRLHRWAAREIGIFGTGDGTRLGRVAEIDYERKDGKTVCIQFSESVDHSFAREIDTETHKGWFEPNTFEVLGDEWTSEQRAQYVFGNNYNALVRLRDKWSDSNPCMCAAHDDEERPKAAMRAVMNLHGTICEIDLCEACAERHHGRRIDGVPYGAPWRRKAS